MFDRLKIDRNILIDLDCIIDARWGLLLAEVGLENLDFDIRTFRERNNDKIIKDALGISDEELQAKLDSGNVDYLAVSGMTDIATTLGISLLGMEIETMKLDDRQPVNLYVNFGPYMENLDDQEIEDIKAGIKSMAGELTDVYVVSYTDLALTPNFVKNTYGKIVKYNPSRWIEHHLKEIEKAGLQGLTIYTPAILHSTRYEQEDDAGAIMGSVSDVGTSPWEIASISCAQLFDLYFVTPKLFSIVDPRELKASLASTA